MKLLVITQTVDSSDTTLGFFHSWIGGFAERFEHVDVICLKKGMEENGLKLSHHVQVFSLGKEKRQNKISYVLNFYKYIWQERHAYDAVFVHMNQEYVLLGGLFWKLMGKSVYLWRNHPYGDMWTRIAVMLADKVFCTSTQSFTSQFEKTRIMPAGIDTKLFQNKTGVERTKHSLLMFGRVAPIKKVEMAIDVLALLKSKHVECTLSIVGDARPQDKGYVETLHDRAAALGVSNIVRFEKGMPFAQGAQVYQSHEIFLNFTPSGSFDKTIIEALASGMKVVSTNLSMKVILPVGSYTEDKPERIAESIQHMLSFDEAEAREYGEEARIIAKNQSLDALMDMLLTCIKEKK